MTSAARIAVACAAGLLMAAAAGKATLGQGFPKPTIQEGPIEIRGSVKVSDPVDARQSGRWTVGLDERAAVRLAAPSFIERGRTYEIRWSEVDRWEKYQVHEVDADGWVVATAAGSSARLYLNVSRAVAIARVGG